MATDVPANRAVRRSVTDLSTEDWERYVAAIWTMKNTPTAEGQELYGSTYKTYDYFVVKHAVASLDTRGDQMHWTDSMGTGHALYLREFEVNLLLIDPDIGGLPYWDAETDIFNDQYVGEVPGAGTDYTLSTGKFANFPVNSAFSMSDWTSYLKTVDGASNGFDPQHGFLRSAENTNTATSATRLGASTTFDAVTQQSCIDDSECWNDWYQCVDGATTNWHSAGHSGIGGRSGLLQGDMTDAITSPNDPVFFLHHNGIERNRLLWMEAHADLRGSYYGYGGLESGCQTIPSFENIACINATSPNPYPITSGIEVTDVVSALFPFTSEQLGLTSITSDGLTHGDALCYLGPDTAPFEFIPPGTRASSAAASPRSKISNSSRSNQWVLYAIGLMASFVAVGGMAAVGFLFRRQRRGNEEKDEDVDGVSLRNVS